MFGVPNSMKLLVLLWSYTKQKKNMVKAGPEGGVVKLVLIEI